MASVSDCTNRHPLFLRALYVVVVSNLFILVVGAIVEMGPFVDTHTLRRWSFPNQRPAVISALWFLQEMAMYAGPVIFLVSLLPGDRRLIVLGLIGAIGGALQYLAAIVPLV